METSTEFGVYESFIIALQGYGLTIFVAVAAAGLIWLIVVVLEAMQKKRKAAVAAVPAAVTVAVEPELQPEDETAKHVAAITAAVYAALGAHRLVYIGEAQPAVGWRTTGRVIHQSSHMPKRSPVR